MLEPLSYDVDALTSGARFANLSALAHADALSNLVSLYTAGDNRTPVRGLTYRFSLLGTSGLEDLTPLVTQFYPAHQETIWGTEGLILTQRVFVPRAVAYERAVCWLIEVQAEGPRVLQVEAQVDVGDATEVELRDGLLVAVAQQGRERPAVVFGSTGPPTHWEMMGPGRARLFYHVLIEGEVEQPFVLAAAEAGVDLAWNGFLMLTDTEQVFRETARAVDRELSVARVYTPDARVNRALAWAHVDLLRAQQRYRWGHAVPLRLADDLVDVAVAARYALAAVWHSPDFVGRLLDFVTRHAVNPDGGLTAELRASQPDQRAPSSIEATALCLAALGRAARLGIDPRPDAFARGVPPAPAAVDYLRRHADPSLAAAAAGVADPTLPSHDDGPSLRAWLRAIDTQRGRNDGAAEASNGGTAVTERAWRWLASSQPSADDIVALILEAGEPVTTEVGVGAGLLALAVEGLLGLTPCWSSLAVTPHLPAAWPWLAVSRVPYQGQPLTLAVLDGVIHSTVNVASPGRVEVYDKADIIPGDVFALLFERGQTRHLFVAADTARMAFVRVGDRGIPVQLAAGEARLMAVE